jgi:nicotinamidase-related amidase
MAKGVSDAGWPSLGEKLPWLASSLSDMPDRKAGQPRSPLIMPADSLQWGPLTQRTIHLCVDMQNMFAGETPWHTPWMTRVLPCVEAIVASHPDRTIFTRFMPPNEPGEMNGSWQRYFERWREMTRSRIDPRLLDLVEPLKRFVPPATVLDKPFYSPFHRTPLAAMLGERACDALVISGAETDMCVLSTVLDAVDLGLRVVLPADALCSSSDEMHDALLGLYRNRFSEQVETATTDEVLACWR